jgi:hypothetical protein
VELKLAEDKQTLWGKAGAHFAAECGNIDCLRLLHGLGADLGLQDASSQTPAHHAAKTSNLECLRVLGELGADFGQLDNDGNSVLDMAAGYAKQNGTEFLSLDTMALLLEYGAVLTIPVVAAMISERDEGMLSTNLRAIQYCLQGGVLSAKNPIYSALVVSAAFNGRMATAQTILAELLVIQKQFSQIACTLMKTEAMDDERNAIELLTAPEKGHEIDTAFEAGAISVAVDSMDGDFIAQPVCRRLVDKIWLGGDWALQECKKFYASSWNTTDFYEYICETKMIRVKVKDAATGNITKVKKMKRFASVEKLLPLFKEVANPSKMRRVPVVRYSYETILGLYFIILTMQKIIEISHDPAAEMGYLLVFIFGNILYELGQVYEDGFAEYIR